MILPIAIDSFVKENVAGANFGDTPRLWVNGGGSADQRFAYLYHSRPFPLGARILTAKLRLFLDGSWSGTNSLTVKRITSAWSESKLNWNNKPTVTATNSAAASVVGGTDGQVVEFDIMNMTNDISSGSAFFGFRIEMSQHADRAFKSSDVGNSTLRPELEVTWTLAPDAPSDLSPAAGDIISAQFPLLYWAMSFPGGGSLTSVQVQMNLTNNDFSAPTKDFGKVALLNPIWDTNQGGFGGVTAGQTWWWRLRVYDDTDTVSDWSTPVSFTRTALGTLTISSPGATTADLTPPITWALSGQTQESYRVTLSRLLTNGKWLTLWVTAGVGTTTSVTVPENLIVTGQTYKVRVEAWDTLNRAGDEHRLTEQTFTYVRDGTPAAPTSMSATAYNDTVRNTPIVKIVVTRTAQPDYWSVKLNGVEYNSRIIASTTFISGTTYNIYIWGVLPRTTTTVEVEAVVLSGGVFKHSSSNPTASVKTDFIGIWLGDDSNAGLLGSIVPIFGASEVDMEIHESGTTYDTVGSQVPVRLYDAILGYRGVISGYVLSKTERDVFLSLKSLSVTQDIRLVLGDLSFPIRIAESSANPRPEPGDFSFDVSFSFFQSGPPWPIPAL